MLALTLGLLVSCRTVQHPQQQSRLDAPPVPPQVGLSVERGVLTLDVRFTTLRDTTSPQHHFVFGIDSIIALLQVRGQARFDTTLYLALINGTSGFQEKIDSIGTEGIAHWTNPLGLPIDTLHCEIRISTLTRKQYVVQLDTVLALPRDSMPPFVTVTPSLMLKPIRALRLLSLPVGIVVSVRITTPQVSAFGLRSTTSAVFSASQVMQGWIFSKYSLLWSLDVGGSSSAIRSNGQAMITMGRFFPQVATQQCFRLLPSRIRTQHI